MITIGLTVCDNDYENCQKVLDQIKHKVKVNLDKSLLKFFLNTLKNKYGADYVSTVFKGSYLGHTDIGRPIKKLIG